MTLRFVFGMFAMLIIASACSSTRSSVGSMTPRPPTQSTAGFEALVQRFDSSSFYLVYDVIRGPYDKEQFVWIQSDGRTRWDAVANTQGGLIGITELHAPPLATECLWATPNHSLVASRVSCSASRDGSFRALKDILRTDGPAAPPPADLESLGDRQVGGEFGHCFSRRFLLVSGTICLSSAGIPLAVDIQGLFSIELKERRDATAASVLFTPPISGGDGTADNVPVDKLTLPNLSIVADYERGN